MKRLLAFSVICLFFFPGFLSALGFFQFDLIDGSIGYPSFYGLQGLSYKVFPFYKSKLFLSRIGLIGEFFGEHEYHGNNGPGYVLSQLLPLRAMFMVFPSSITQVETRSPFYCFLFAGTEVSALGHKVNDQASAWGGGDAGSLCAGLCLSFRGVIEANLIYNRMHIDDHLGLNRYGDFVEYVPDWRSNKFYAYLQLNIGTALIEWIKPNKPE